MATLSQLITNAILKVSSDPAYAGRDDGMSSEEARALFTSALLAELGLSQAVTPVVEKKVRKTKVAKTEEKTEEETKVEVKAEEKTEEETKVEVKTEEKKVKKPRAKKAAEAKPETETEAEKTETEEKKVKKPRAKKAAEAKPETKTEPEAEENKPRKLNPTENKKIKTIAEELKVEVDRKALVAYLVEHADDGQTFEAQVRAFLTPKPSEKTTETKELEIVEFNGVEYHVDPETKRIFKPDETGKEVFVGDVGLREFAEMTL